MSVTGIWLEPLDVLFFRDGRPFGAATRMQGGLPTPQTFAGAVRTALLQKYRCDFARLRGATNFATAVADVFPDRAWIGAVRFRGPWLTRGKEILVAAPAVLHQPKKGAAGDLVSLAPLPQGELPGWRPEERWGTRPLWARRTAATEPARGFLTTRGLRAFLEGKRDNPVTPGDLVRPDALFDFDHRTGIRIEADRLTAEESQIYAISFLALKQEVGLYGEAVLPEAPPDALAGIDVLALGGEGRRVRMEVGPASNPLTDADAAGKQKRLVMLTTPALCKALGPPEGLPRLAASAVQQPLAVSGWDLAQRGPRRTRFALPAGSVFFLDETSAPLPESLSDSDAALGWGCYVKGVWTDA